uniref:Uncharacterized protein n=1 Tax=Rhizophora mucronata TaxID=61149 RepID=A0A2P2K4X3_RHIMU
MMLNIVHAQNPALFNKSSLFYLVAVNSHRTKSSSSKGTTTYPTKSCSSLIVTSLFAACAVLVSTAGTIEAVTPQAETLSNIPQMLSGECASAKDCKRARIQHPKSRKAESCTIKCVATCIRGGEGSPGEGPLNIIRPPVVFKQGFRSRQYW